MVGLEKVMIYRFKMKGPLASTVGSPLGERQYWEMSEGILSGDGINARIALPGGDWMLVGTDGYWRPDVRVQLVTDDDAIILLHYVGLVKPDEKFMQAAINGLETQFDDQYLRQFMRFDTGVEKYAWLTQNLYLAEGRLAGSAEIEYQIYKIT